MILNGDSAARSCLTKNQGTRNYPHKHTCVKPLDYPASPARMSGRGLKHQSVAETLSPPLSPTNRGQSTPPNVDSESTRSLSLFVLRFSLLVLRFWLWAIRQSVRHRDDAGLMGCQSFQELRDQLGMLDGNVKLLTHIMFDLKQLGRLQIA